LQSAFADGLLLQLRSRWQYVYRLQQLQRQSIGAFFQELSGTIPEMAEMEFYPSPAATRELVDRQYQIRHNLLVRFFDDSIDEITDLAGQLKRKFPDTVKVLALQVRT
jgi:hypothetical protein